uniref:HAT C-terminal dimerisation domain-containing protein n=1 Tax=Arundo donax TaxID=35708 RepID=A0A0A9DQ40_ARUDO
MFNDVIEKMIADDDDLIAKVSDLADEYESTRSSFGKKLPTLQQKKKSPNDWWSAYGGCAEELKKIAWHIVGLSCSASGYDRTWTMIECINTTFINQSERKRLEDYAYIRYNRMMADRFERQRSEGSYFDPLIREDCEFEYDWVGMYAELHNRDDLAWQLVEEVTCGSYTLEDHYRSRRSFCDMMNSEHGSSTSRLADETDSDTEEDDESFVVDDEDIEDDYGQQDPPTPSDDSDGPSGNVDRMVDPFDLDDFLKDL